MESKKGAIKKINLLKVTKKEQERILREALSKGQKEQRLLEKKYDRLLTRKYSC